MNAKHLLLGVLFIVLGANSVFAAVSPEQLVDDFTRANHELTQVLKRELAPEVKNPRWDTISDSLMDVEKAYSELVQADKHDVKAIRRNGKLVFVASTAPLAFFLFNDAYYALMQVNDSGKLDLFAKWFKLDSKEGAWTRVKWTTIGGAAVAVIGGGYYLYAREKSKALKKAVDAEVKTAALMFSNMCRVRGALEEYYRQNNRMDKIKDRFPVITQACMHPGFMDARASR